MGIIAKPFGWLLTLIYNLVGNYGLTLIIFTFLICLCLIPLYASQIKGTAKMAEIQPKIQEIQTRYANDRETMNAKLQELYAKEKYSPAKGCLPMLIQMPIIMGLFSLLRNPLAFIGSEVMIMGVHESFLWIPDLSQPDPWILPILAGVAQFLTTWVSQLTSANPNAAMAGGSNKMMMYLFPVMIFWLGKSMPAGLCMYWFIRSLFTVVQTVFLNNARKKALLRAKIEKELG